MAEQITLRGILDRFIPHATRVNAGRQSQLRLFVLFSFMAGVTGLVCAWIATTRLDAMLTGTVMVAASLMSLAAPICLSRSKSPNRLILFGYMSILCLAIAGCSALGGFSAPTLPLLLPLPVLAYVFLDGQPRIYGLAAYVASLLTLVGLDAAGKSGGLGLSIEIQQTLFTGAVLLSAIVTLVLLWQFDSLQGFWRDQQRNETLKERVTGENLELAKRTAELDSLAKSRLLASVSMDLRAPLTAIIGFSQIIGREMMGPIGNNQYQSYAEDIESSGYKVLETIERVLDLARLQAGEFRLKETSFDLVALLREIIGELKPMAENADIRVSVRSPIEHVYLFADQRAIRQIMMNLLANALHYADFGGQASASVAVGDRGEAILTIWNNGPTIEPERLPLLFEPCAVDTSLGAEQFDEDWLESSPGLGLPVSRLLAERHGGTLEIESAPEAGTTVTVTIPPARVSMSDQPNPVLLPRRAKTLYSLTPVRAPDGQ